VIRTQGRNEVVMRIGKARRATIKVPPGHLAVVERAATLTHDELACAAALARHPGLVTAKTRRIMAELARRG